MAEFKFKMKNILDHRMDQERACYKLFIQCQIRLQDALRERKRLEEEKMNIWKTPSTNINELTTKEFYIKKIEHNISCYNHIINTLQKEKNQAEENWNKSRIELKAMEKLKENNFRDWMIQQNKIEQQELDEWSVTSVSRRKSA